MNFMSGFSEEHQIITGSRGIPSSSSSSTLHHFTYHHTHHHQDGGGAGPGEGQHSNGGGEDGAGVLEGTNGAAAASSHVLMEREHMFDKVVTPSDVGKLNRLVIPKQHAEKYFPLDSSTNEKGLLLNFEDRNGKPWRFRYSYWNSSQSYVMTKGWSRFVKEKKLDAGDIVSFQRGMGESGKDRLFIDWRRRPDAPDHFPTHQIPIAHQFSFHRSNIHPWNPLFMQQHHPPPSREYSHFLQAAAANAAASINPTPHINHHYPHPYNSYNTTVVNGNPCPPGSILYLRSTPGGGGGGTATSTAAGVGLFGPQQMGMMQTQRRSGSGGGVDQQMVFESVPVVQGKAAAKRLRLFGVNMDCPVSDSDECDMLLSHSNAPLLLEPLTHISPPAALDSSSSSSPPIPSLLRLRTYDHSQEKGKGSMSLDLDI